MNLLSRILMLIPYLLAGIEQVHQDAPGATKKQIAFEALGLAATSATALLPGEQTEIAAAKQVASVAIDATVAAAHATGLFKKKK